MRLPAAVLAVALAARAALAGGGPAETVVLVNAESPDSRRVADAYVRARNVPPQQVCEVRCTTALETTIGDFVRDVADPLREFLRRRGLEDRVSFVVTTQGMPIRARTGTDWVSTTAALSLLHSAHLGRDQVRVQSPWRSPAYRGALAAQLPRAIECERFLHVTALLASTADEALGLLTRSVASDGTAPGGALWVFQDANGNAGTRNASYDAARRPLDELGQKTEHVPAGAEAAANRRRVMGYMSGGSYSALTPAGVATNEYLPGAVCDHLQSFGAVPQNFDADPGNDTQFPVVHMVRAGITGVHGAVAEPYTVAFPDPDLFTAYAQGATLAETFSARLPLGYWMNLVLGDPLCAPYAKRPAVTLSTAAGPISAKAPGAVRIALYVDGVLVASADGEEVAAPSDAAALPAGPHHVLAEATGPGEHEPRGWAAAEVVGRGPAAASAAAARAAAAKVTVSVPGSATAGETFDVKVVPRDAAGAPVPGWKGRVELRVAVPPVRLAKLDVESVPEGGVAVPLRMTRAGDAEITVVLTDDGVRLPAKVRIAAGPPHHATTPLDRVPLGQACDVDVVVEDEFGNLAAFDAPLSLSVPTDAFATLPEPARAAQGRAVLRDLVLTRPGRHALVFADGDGKAWSQPGEGAEAVHTAVRTWLVSQAFRGDDAAKALAADPSAGADRDGCAAGGRLWRRARPRSDDLALPAPGTKDGDAVAAVAFLKVLNPSKVRLLAAGPSRIVVFVDGKQVFDGLPKTADVRGKREAVAELTLAEGLRRLTVVAQRKDRAPAFSLEIDDGAGKHADSVLAVAAASDEAPERFVASGRVGRGNRGVPNAKVTVRTADGAERTAVTGPDGLWFVDGLAPGAIEVRAQGQHPLQPPSRAAAVEGRNVTDLDFTSEDRTPPSLKADAGAGRFGKSLVLEPQVEDDDGVRDVRLLLDGEETAKLTAAPWRFSVDVSMKARGKHEVVIVAADPSGNETRSGALAVTFVDDAKGPVVKVSGVSNGAQVKKRTDVSLTVTDDLPVASVRFRIDGKDAGAPRTAPPWTCTIDPSALAEGSHSLAVTARDLDGNETLVEVTFKTRK